MTPLEYLEIENKDLIKKLEKNLLRGKVTKVMTDFAKYYHNEQLNLSGVSQHRELLLAFDTMRKFDIKHDDIEESIDYFLKNKESYL